MAAKQLSDFDLDGTSLGQSGTDKISFYGATPVAQRAAATQASSLVSASAYTSATHATLLEVVNTLTALGLWKGSA